MFKQILNLINICLQVIDFNESNMWYLTFILLAILAIVIVLRSKGSRKRILANQIPGPDGTWLIGMLPLLLQRPEKLIKSGTKLYKT